MSENKRELLKKVYPSKKWIERVNAMDDEQVVVIFLRLRSQGKV